MLFFLDIETTGLNPETDDILEIACVAYNGSSQVGSYSQLIKAPAGWEDKMNDFVQKMHTDNGLIKDLEFPEGLDIVMLGWADREITEFIDAYRGEEKAYLAGNSIQFDRSFIKAQMPLLENVLHYRMLDIRSVIRFTQLNWPELMPARNVEPAHRAHADAVESIRTYEHYVDLLNPRKNRRPR